MAALDKQFSDHGFSDDSDHDLGYDSEAAEAAKGGRVSVLSKSSKRRKLFQPSDDAVEVNTGSSGTGQDRPRLESPAGPQERKNPSLENTTSQPEVHQSTTSVSNEHPTAPNDHASKSRSKHNHKTSRPGVIYLSSLPPHLKPSPRNTLLLHRGFSPITRLFLTPASTSRSSTSSSRRLYTEGWLEFSSKKTARRCAETLNAQPVGGKKGGYYRDDVWNMRYLKGMVWEELMAGIREERREEEVRSAEERRRVRDGAREFMSGVQRRKEVDGMKKRRRKSGGEREVHGDGQDSELGNGRVWRQFQVKEKDGDRTRSDVTAHNMQTLCSGSDLTSVLGQIF